jgi:hypothetical protein
MKKGLVLKLMAKKLNIAFGTHIDRKSQLLLLEVFPKQELFQAEKYYT